MVTNDATTPAFDWRAGRKEIAVTSVENGREALMGNSE